MSLWFSSPVWQNYSSMFREATAAGDAKSGMEKSHHLTASLYFGMAALEAFLNAKMRTHLQPTNSEDDIFDTLRKGRLMDKLKKWPSILLHRSLDLPEATFDLITAFNDVRADLTHPKTSGFEIYSRLEAVDPDLVIKTVAEYIARFHEAEQTRFPYWLFGWNYLNPRQASHEIILINDQQFCFSMRAIGFDVPTFANGQAEAWRETYLGTFEGYMTVRDSLAAVDRCEPKSVFPFAPILCRRWWTAEHQKSCGYVSSEALASAT